MEKIDIIRTMFAIPVDGSTFEYRPDFETDALRLLPGAINHLSGLSSSLPQQEGSDGSVVRDGKRRFLDVMAALTKAYSLCNTMDETRGYKNEIAFYSAIKTAFIKHSTVDKNGQMKNETQR